MKASKILAGMSAMALAASMLSALPVSAANPANGLPEDSAFANNYNEDGYLLLFGYEKDDDGNVVSEDPIPGTYYETAKDASFVCGVKYTIVADDETAQIIANRNDPEVEEKTWIGGGFGFQAKNGDADYDKTNNWVSFGEWASAGEKDFNLEPVEGEANTFTLEYKGDKPLFTKDDNTCALWIQSWGEGNFTITDIELYELEEQPIGNAYIALGANSKYSIAADTSEEAEGQIVLSDWQWGDDTQTWGHYAGIAAPDFTSDFQSIQEAWDAFAAKLDEGRTPTGVTLTGDGPFGFGYNSTEEQFDEETGESLGFWKQTSAVKNDETGKYELVITDIPLGEPTEKEEGEEQQLQADPDADVDVDGEGDDGEAGEAETKTEFEGAKFYDPGWGWGYDNVGDEFILSNVTWAFNYGEEEVIGSWNTFNSALADYKTTDEDGNEVDNAAHSVDVGPENAVVYLDREFEISVDFAQELAKIWYLAPTIVFNEAPEGDLNDLYEVSVRCEINDAEYEVDAAKPEEPNVDKEGNPVTIWNEGTGPYSSDIAGRTYGGCNEWAAKATYIGESAFGTDFVANNDGTYTGGEGPVNGVERVKYFITISEKEQPVDESTPDSSTADSTPESTTESTPEGGTNPGTGTAALATVGVALAAAAFVVSKKRK